MTVRGEKTAKDKTKEKYVSLCPATRNGLCTVIEWIHGMYL